MAEKSLMWLEECSALAGPQKRGKGLWPRDHSISLVLLDRAEMSLALERYDDVETLAMALRRHDTGQGDPFLDHHAAAYLGLVALRRAKVAEAGGYLRDSAEVDALSSPALNSFGPSDESIRLADELLRAGDRQSVHLFLTTVVESWRPPGMRTTLMNWADQIRQGATPRLQPQELAAPRITRFLDGRRRQR